MAWADGRFAATLGDAHQWTQQQNSYRVVLPGPFEPGDAAVTVSHWPDDASPVGVYTAATAAVAGTPSPFVPPTQPSGQSLWPFVRRSLFHCRPADIQSDDLLSDLTAAGVAHLEVGIFNSPADNPGWSTFALWLAAWESLCRPNIDWCAANGFRVVGIGDDLFRTPAERDWLHTSPFAQQAVEHVAAYLRDSGVCDGVEVVDEIGDDPDEYAPGDFVSWWRGAGGPPLAWPHQYPVQWEVPELSDYSSRYWTDHEWRPGRAPPLALTAWQQSRGIGRAALDVPVSRPWACLVATAGPFYTKLTPGGDYQAGDLLQKGGCSAQDIITQVWLALARGASGVRLYGYDWSLWRDERANAPIGRGDLQTGARPGDARRPGVVAALSSVAAREAALLGTPYTPTASGPWVFGRRVNLVWAVNTSERSLPSPNGAGTVLTPAGEGVGATVPAGGVIVW